MAKDAMERTPSLRESVRFAAAKQGGTGAAYAAVCLICLVTLLVWHGALVPGIKRALDLSLFGFAGLCIAAFLVAGKLRSRSLLRSLRTAPFVAAAFLLTLLSVGNVMSLSGLLAAVCDPVLHGWHSAVSALPRVRVVELVVSSTLVETGWGSIAIVAILLATGRQIWLAAYLGCKAATIFLLPTAVQMAARITSFSPLKVLYDQVDTPSPPNFGLASFLASPRHGVESMIHPYVSSLGLGWLSCPTLDQILFLALAWTVRKTPLGWPGASAAAVALLWSTESTGQYVTDLAVGAAFAFAFMAIAVVVLAAFLQEATAVHDDGILAAEAEALTRPSHL